jgi:hypothetical protein
VKEDGDGNFSHHRQEEQHAETVVDKAGKPLQGKSNLTESQGKALGFGQRAVEAHNIILGLEHSGDDGQVRGGEARCRQRAAHRRHSGGAIETLRCPAAQQKYEQAQRDFINAVLRPESGATITDTEFEREEAILPAGRRHAGGHQAEAGSARARDQDAQAMAGPGAKQFPEIKRPKGKATLRHLIRKRGRRRSRSQGWQDQRGDKITVGGKPGTWQ